MANKFFTLVLHTHLPYVINHGNWPHGMDWLYEAAAESYLPLLDVFYRLSQEGYEPSVSISFTPVLSDQLASQSFKNGFKKYLLMKIEAAEKDRFYFEKSGQRELAHLAVFWSHWYEKQFEAFVYRWQEDLIAAFRQLQNEGKIEILTSAATHAYLPLLSQDSSLRLQMRVGKVVYEHYFERSPKGFWLPECAYRPGYLWSKPVGNSSPMWRPAIDVILKEIGFNYFLVDLPLLRASEVKGVYFDRFPALKKLWEKSFNHRRTGKKIELSPYFPYFSEPSGLAFFARDDRTGHQVWSSSSGYPGDGWYLEFHKKNFPGGLRYWRVTANNLDLGEKEIYQPDKAKLRLESQATHFVSLLFDILKETEEGVIASFYDTELFGHWWFEGPEWLYFVIKNLASSPIQLEKTSACLEKIKPKLSISLPEGSWGSGGFHWLWLNEDTVWIWEKIYWLEEETLKLKRKQLKAEPRLWVQLFREKLLLESSDWPFLISTWTARDYAENRAALHYERARTLINWIKRDSELSLDESKLLTCWENEDGLFSKLSMEIDLYD
ncbi:MAG: DUF1957 domain-containing protein [Candidatus Aminicenantes bacterium]|nr:DUF1957 domain-containing protein [Candidatus Aminicenantes bacterium]